jgi:hypothetical protein
MTTDPAALLHLDCDRVCRAASRLDLLSRELAAVAEPREPDVGQHRLIEGRLALPLAQPARLLVDLLAILSAVLVAAARGAATADDDSAALSGLLMWETR